MNNSGLTAGDILALTKGGDGFNFGGVGGFVLLFIFLLAIGGNGFGWGGSNAATALGQSDLQNSLYFQSQDNAIRGLAQGQCAITDTILNNKYDNAVLIKDLSAQIAEQTATITNLFNEQTIDRLRDQVTVLRGQNSNLMQTAEITQNILGNLATTAPKPPCYYGYGCGCNSLY